MNTRRKIQRYSGRQMPTLIIFEEETIMNIIKLFGAIGAAALAAGGLIVAGRTGLGKSEDPVDNDKAPEEGGEPEATEAEVVQTESDDGSANA